MKTSYANGIRLIGADGETLRSLGTPSGALIDGEEAGLDLWSRSRQCHPPVWQDHRIWQFNYEERKSAKQSAQKQKSIEIKSQVALIPDSGDLRGSKCGCFQLSGKWRQG